MFKIYCGRPVISPAKEFHSGLSFWNFTGTPSRGRLSADIFPSIALLLPQKRPCENLKVAPQFHCPSGTDFGLKAQNLNKL